MASLVPVIFFIASIPITPFGLGTLQAGMLFLFKDYSNQGNILAFSIAYATGLLLLRAIIGLSLFFIDRRDNNFSYKFSDAQKHIQDTRLD